MFADNERWNYPAICQIFSNRHSIGRERPRVPACHIHQISLGRTRASLTGPILSWTDVTSPDTTGCRHRIEVKTISSASAGQVEFFLTSNEAAVGMRDPGWSLVAVRRNRDGSLELIGWCSSDSLIPHLPRDISRQGRWASARLSIAVTEFGPGLPLIESNNPLPCCINTAASRSAGNAAPTSTTDSSASQPHSSAGDG